MARMAKGSALIIICLVCVSGTSWGANNCVAAPNADVIYVRPDCSGFSDCCPTLTDALDWTWNERQPGPGDRVVMDIGPGEWNERWTCSNNGHVTVRGAGRDGTVIKGDGSAEPSAAIISDCFELEFIDIGFEARDFTIFWSNEGSSTWTNVDILNPGTGVGSVGWYDNGCNPETDDKALHYFFGSRIEARGRKNFGGFVPATPYWAKCSETWFYGGELHWLIDSSGGGLFGGAVVLDGNSDFRAFGTALRTTVLEGVSTGPAYGIRVSENSLLPGGPTGKATFHMHGGIISITNKNETGWGAIVGLQVEGDDALVHMPETAFAFKAPPGSAVVRMQLLDGGKVDAPFMWKAGATPPSATPGSESGGFYSGAGQDMFVETDCGATGDCAGGGNETHLMIYNDSLCGSTNPWFDVVTGACRVTGLLGP